jgi:tRNA (cytidine/uridine-2'-O-)-methyltransferase
MLHVILYQPEIPPNTGNVIRLCANTGFTLHLIEPLGFKLEDKHLQRAGLDYHELACVRLHPEWSACTHFLPDSRLFAISTRGLTRYDVPAFEPGDAFLFGRETSGLPEQILGQFSPERRLRLPMQAGNRSLNLSNAVAVVCFEAWRQTGFQGSADPALALRQQ